MAFFAILLLLLVLFVIAAPFMLMASQRSLKTRIEVLEDKILALESGAATSSNAPMEPTVKPSEVPDRTHKTPHETATNTPTEAPAAQSQPSSRPEMPLVAKQPAPTAPKTPDGPNPLDRFLTWIQANWVLAAGALSLGLAGIFLVQYGAERGLLTPSARIVMAVVFGGLLLSGGEFLRRRFGDEDDSTMQFLPSALSGAGIFTLFAAVLAARQLYELIGPTPAFIYLVLVSTLGIVFGWFYGALLSGLGIVGAIAAPYLVGGGSDNPWFFLYYFTMIAVAALTIDSVKRWAWLSVLALAGAGASIWLIHLGAGAAQHFLACTLIIVVAALIIPEQQLSVRLDGPMVAELFSGSKDQRFPVWLGFATVANAALASSWVGSFGNVTESYLALIILVGLLAATLFWLARAPALFDLALLPAIALLLILALQGQQFGALYQSFHLAPPPEVLPSPIGWQLALMGVACSFMGIWRLRSAQAGIQTYCLSLGSAIFAPATIFLLEFIWTPAAVYGPWAWAMVVIGVAAAMTFLCERLMRDPQLERPKLHGAFFAGAAISLISLALFILLTKSALTLALAVMVLAIVIIDRRFNLPHMDPLVQLGLAIISYRIVIDPGLFQMEASYTPLYDVFLVHIGTAAVLAAAIFGLRPGRVNMRAGLEGSIAIIAAAFAFVIHQRLFDAAGTADHGSLGVLVAVWLIVGLVQLKNSAGARWFERCLRIGVGGLIVGIALLTGCFAFAFENPLVSYGEPVSGWPFLSSLALAYLPAAAVLGFVALKMTEFPKILMRAAGALSIGLCVWYIALSIRHIWQGPYLNAPGVTDPELYSYTLAMLISAATMLFVAFNKRDRRLKSVAMGIVGLTIAKVFLIDMSGLTGLVRVLSFMGLGLSLLALTWLNRVMEVQWDSSQQPPDHN